MPVEIHSTVVPKAEGISSPAIPLILQLFSFSSRLSLIKFFRGEFPALGKGFLLVLTFSSTASSPRLLDKQSEPVLPPRHAAIRRKNRGNAGREDRFPMVGSPA